MTIRGSLTGRLPWGRGARAGGEAAGCRHVAAQKEAEMGLLDGLFKNKADKPGKPDFSGVQGGGSSTAPAPAAPGPITASRGGGTYTVVKGDSLSRIAKQQYGDASKWRTIYEANRDVIKDPDLIYPGQSLKIPEA